MKKACVFCASSDKVDDIYKKTAAEIGEILVQNQYATVYGGGEVGLMGALAKSVLKNKGEIIGVIPQFMVDMNWGYSEVSEMIVTETMMQRKETILSLSQLAIALPGGCGTLDELLDAITLKQLGQFNYPIIIVNTNGFYDMFIAQLKTMIQERFMREIHEKIWTVIDKPSEFINAINNSLEWDSSSIHSAAV